MENLGVIILAAGKGTRLNYGKPSQKPKVLFEIAGRPMITYTISTIKKLKPKQIVIVVGYKADLVKKILGNNFDYAYQEKVIGTADATSLAIKKLAKSIDTILILNGDDSAFYNVNTLQNLISTHIKNKNILTFLTLKVRNPHGLGRVVRDKNGKVVKIVEEKVATESEKKIKEINLNCYLAELSWLKSQIEKVKKSKAGEYYLVDIVKLAYDGKVKMESVLLKDRDQWQGINTVAELKKANQMMRARTGRQAD